MVAPFWDAEHGGEEVGLLFFSPPPFGGNLLVGRNPFFEIPFAGLPPTFEAGFRCWGTITKVFAHLWNEKQAWPHISPGADTKQEFEKEKSKIQINPKTSLVKSVL